MIIKVTSKVIFHNATSFYLSLRPHHQHSPSRRRKHRKTLPHDHERLSSMQIPIELLLSLRRDCPSPPGVLATPEMHHLTCHEQQGLSPLSLFNLRRGQRHSGKVLRWTAPCLATVLAMLTRTRLSRLCIECHSEAPRTGREAIPHVLALPQRRRPV